MEIFSWDIWKKYSFVPFKFEPHVHMNPPQTFEFHPSAFELSIMALVPLLDHMEAAGNPGGQRVADQVPPSWRSVRVLAATFVVRIVTGEI